MPASTINLFNAANAIGSDGSMLVASGPGQIPVYDSNVLWDRVNQCHTIKGQEAGSGGNRWVLQDGTGSALSYFDKDGRQCYDLAAISSPAYNKVTPQVLDEQFKATLNLTVSSHVFTGPDYINNVAGLEWNGLAGAPEITGKIVFRDAWENKYLQSGRFQTERHVASMHYPDGSGRELRPITISTAFMSADGTPLDPFISHRTDTWSTLTHFTEDMVQRQKWEWNPATSEWDQFGPGFALYLSSSTCSVVFGANSRNTVLTINGSTAELALSQNGTRKHTLYSSGDTLTLSGPTGQLAYWGSDRQLELRQGVKVANSGADLLTARWTNWDAASGAGDWAWLVSNVGRVRLANLTSGLTVFAAESGKLGFFGTTPAAKPTISGSWGDGSAAQSTAAALATLGLATNSATA